MTSAGLSPGTRPQGASDETQAARRVHDMFARIAPRYDLANHILSFNRDRVWRRRTARALAAPLQSADSRALDLCCGTADLTLELARVSRGVVIGADFVHDMLLRAQEKMARARSGVVLVEADALALPFPDGAFDIVTAAFGFRNLANYQRGLEEIRRVLKPGGEAGILEFALPQRGLFARFYWIYFHSILPWMGGVLSGDRAPYSYLPASVRQFPDCAEFARWMETAGFAEVRYQFWTGGTVVLYVGRKA
ncbi:MAG TPA: bifunctional demethylmenaquinone methyltransferase/2-methoxy-6-polyprenyl-1,4-benzoquinol methylase UbiE [Candidatus Xenobia bacterium]|nr:bifunctional demethylmenaquinone methyltransferase/2-methoxy-6-polyprenyl-1,4-benzoquinol methylase UbiE [Candidatus Xenobia bacterium]